MFDSYTTDVIRIVSPRYDSKGAIIPGSDVDSPDIAARIEDTNKLLRDDEGKEVMGNMLVMFNYDNEINTLNKIKVRKKHGIDYPQKDKKWEIKNIETLGMFGRTHVEVDI